MEEENLVPGTEGTLFETTIIWDATDGTVRAYHDPVDTNRLISDNEVYIGYADRLSETPLTTEQTQEQHETLAEQSINRQIRAVNEGALRAEQRAREHVQRITREHLERAMGDVFRRDENVVSKSRSSSKELMNHLMPFLEELKKEGRLDVDTFNDIYIKMDEYVREVW